MPSSSGEKGCIQGQGWQQAGTGRGDIAARSNSSHPLQYISQSSTRFCCPELTGTRSCLSLTCLQLAAGQRLAEAAQPQAAGLLLRKEKTFKPLPRVVEPFAGFLLSQNHWASGIKIQAQVSNPPPPHPPAGGAQPAAPPQVLVFSPVPGVAALLSQPRAGFPAAPTKGASFLLQCLKQSKPNTAPGLPAAPHTAQNLISQ